MRVVFGDDLDHLLDLELKKKTKKIFNFKYAYGGGQQFLNAFAYIEITRAI